MEPHPEIASTEIETHFGAFELHCFSWGPHEEDHVLCLRKPINSSTPLVRIQSACYTAEIFRSLDCDCHEQLETSLKRINNEGGLLIYMLCDGRGAGLLTKVRGLELGRTMGLDTSDAYRHLGVEQDPRSYERATFVLRHFKINALRLLTNNPRKLDGVAQSGLMVEREPVEISATATSRAYLRTKKEKMGHLLTIPGHE